MKLIIKALGAVTGLAVAIGPAMAADSPAVTADAPVFDVGVEITGATDYMDLGLTNSDHNPSGA